MYLTSVYILYGIGAVQSICVLELAVFQDVERLEGYNITSSILDVTSRYESMDRIECANQCSTLDHCLSFFHNSITNQCQFHTEVFLENTGAASQTGSVYFYQFGKMSPTTATTSTTSKTTSTIPVAVTETPFHCPTEDGFQILGSNEICVKFHTDKKTWSDANAVCASYSPNGHLVVVDTAIKDDLVGDAGISIDSEFSGSLYIGLTIDGWVDGSPLVYTSWMLDATFTSGSIECASYKRSDPWIWKTVDCNLPKHYICQIPF